MWMQIRFVPELNFFDNHDEYFKWKGRGDND
jgi:hypothetical protein